MISRLVHKPCLKVLQAFIVTIFLFVQGYGAAMASSHAASGNWCGDGALPVEVAANIKKLLAMQGEFDEEASLNCELCTSMAVANEVGDSQGCANLSLQLVDRLPYTDSHDWLAAPIGAPVGLRAPPYSTL